MFDKQSLLDLWQEKKTRQIIILGLAGILVMYIGFKMTGDNDSRPNRKDINLAKTKNSFLGVADSATAISSREASTMLNTLSREFKDRERELNVREEEMDRKSELLAQRLDQVESNQFETKQQFTAFAQGKYKRGNTANASQKNRPNAGTPAQPQNSPLQNTTIQPVRPVYDNNGNIVGSTQAQSYTQAPMRNGNVIRTVTQRNIREFKDGEVKEKDIVVRNISARTQRPKTFASENVISPLQAETSEESEVFTLTMGSIISGTLLNGVAAPTSAENQKNPMPVLMRIKREAIMPNHYTIDIRECHLLGSAIGDLSSTRAYIRAEAISCITESGEAIEQNITAYAVSSTDGIAGIEGRVVFKSGAMLANSLKADFIAGAGEALSPRQIPSLNLNDNGNSNKTQQIWETQNLELAGAAGISKGLSSSASRIADFYLQLAESATPVIELIPGIEVDFIVQRGMTLKLAGTKRKE